MPVCPVTLTTAEDGWQYLIWTFFVGAVVALGYTFMDWVHYAYLRGVRFLLLEVIHSLAYVGLVVSAAFAAWRVWSCGGWDVVPIPLLIFVLQILVFAFNIPMLFLTRNYYVSAVWSFVSLCFTVAVLVLFFLEDTWAGVVYILHTIWAVYWFAANIYIAIAASRIAKREVRDAAFADILVERQKRVNATIGGACPPDQVKAQAVVADAIRSVYEDQAPGATRRKNAASASSGPATSGKPALMQVV